MKYRKADEVEVDGNVLRGCLTVTVVGALLVGGVSVAGWKLHWWAAEQTAQKTAQINRETLAFQAGLEDDINQKLPDLANLTSTIAETTDAGERAALNAQAKTVKQSICTDYSQLNQSYILALGDSEQQQLASLCAPGQVAPQQ